MFGVVIGWGLCMSSL